MDTQDLGPIVYEVDGSVARIVLNDPATNPNPAQPSNWILSAREGGTPGESGSGALPEKLPTPRRAYLLVEGNISLTPGV